MNLEDNYDKSKKNSDKLQEMYDLGKEDTFNLLDKINKFIY